jgi:tRNA threonylcarbamoyladenosine biosynthesis protein TsaE
MVPDVIEVASASPADTIAVGRRLARLLRPGDVVLLSGGLGCGKTLFVSGIAEGLGVEERVTSPSFVIVHQYNGGFLPIVHADVYRLSSIGELDDLELPDLARDGVLVIEWGHAVERSVPEDHLVVELEVLGDLDRRIRFVPMGRWSARSLEDVTG